MSDIVFEGVGKSYRAQTAPEHPPVQALQDVSFQARAKTLTCLLGATGCGKSTLLRLCAGLEEPDAGAVRIAGERPQDLLGRVGYVPQSDSLLPWLTVEENVLLPLRVQGKRLTRADHERAAEALARVGLDQRTQSYPYECSGGMRQRAMLARQIVGAATVWLLDEPFSALDERTRWELQDCLIALRDELRLTILFVTHSVEEAVYLADALVVLGRAPRGVIEGRTLALSRPRDRFGAEASEAITQLRLLMEGPRSGV